MKNLGKEIGNKPQPMRHGKAKQKTEELDIYAQGENTGQQRTQDFMSTKDSPCHPQLRQLNANLGCKVYTGKEVKGKGGSGQPHGAADVDEKARGGKRNSKTNQTQGIHEKAGKQNAIWDAAE